MKTFDLAAHAGEFILGARQTGSHACYLIHGRMAPGESGRLVNPGAGHEEILLAVTGDFELTGALTGTLRQGQAVHLAGDTPCQLRNLTDREALYVAAGGHTPGTDHH